MRKQFCEALVARAARPDLVFLTGDLGFMALEPLQAALGPRFINAGVAEQNMVSVAAGLAQQGLETWVYSIAPFCYARPFEQIRNDVAFHALPVKLVGNGGGYGYGVMGPTHHAIEDYGVLLTLPGMHAFTPVFDEDIAAVIECAGTLTRPSYLRLGRGEPPKGFDVPPYAPWRQLAAGSGPVVIAVGPLAGTYIEAALALPESVRPNLWAVAELPLVANPLPAELQAQVAACAELHVAEEHVARGSFGAELALWFAEHGLTPRRFVHHTARAHNFGRYGSQAWMRGCSGLDAATVLGSLDKRR
jgi:transketolase